MCSGVFMNAAERAAVRVARGMDRRGSEAELVFGTVYFGACRRGGLALHHFGCEGRRWRSGDRRAIRKQARIADAAQSAGNGPEEYAPGQRDEPAVGARNPSAKVDRPQSWTEADRG